MNQDRTSSSRVDDRSSAPPTPGPFRAPVVGELADGLEGIVVAETELACVDGEHGQLVIRGHQIEDLAGRLPYEAICQLLWGSTSPDPSESTSEPKSDPASLQAELGAARVDAFGRLSTLGSALDADDGMEAIRAALAHLPAARDDEDPGGEAIRITGALAVFAGEWSRRHLRPAAARGASPLAPDPALPHATDALRMLTGRTPTAAAAAAFDTYLSTVAEHGMCASTFTARVVASTRSDTISAIVAAVGALKGPLHGGAPGPVLDMLDEIAAPEAARAWIEAELDAGRRIMGMGHRVYRVRDPRAAVLERAIERLAAAGEAADRLALAHAVEHEAAAVLRERYPGRPLEANVEFYTAVLLDAVGLHRALFTPAFAIARVAGWLAHVEEQRVKGRIIRPKARYVGPWPSAA